jgi:hypothetical protein
VEVLGSFHRWRIRGTVACVTVTGMNPEGTVGGLAIIGLMIAGFWVVLKFVGWLGDTLGSAIESILTDDDDK